MIVTTIVNGSGKPLRVLRLPDSMDPEDQCDIGEFAVLGAKPPGHVCWHFATASWIPDHSSDPTIEQLKAAKEAEIVAARVSADMRFQHAGKWFQADPAAWKQITGVHGLVLLTGALPPPPFPNQWKAEDNTYHPINSVADWVAFYGSAIARGAANFSQSEALRAQVAAATTPAQLDAIQWAGP